MQIPRQPLSADIEGAAASGLFDAVGTGFEKKGGSPGANTQSFERKLLDERLRRAASREPGRPDLHGGCAWEAGTAVASWIRQEVAQPPGARIVGQTEAQEPRLIAAAHAEPGERQIQRSHPSSLERFAGVWGV